jgi:hypothetical protein
VTAAERALAAIDAGLQSSPEHGYGTDVWPDRCARCQLHPPVADGSLCAGCRTYLLGDTDTDPRMVAVHGQLTPEQAEALVAVFRNIVDAFNEAMRGLAEALTSIGTGMAEWLADVQAALERIEVQPEPQLCPRGHGPTKAGLCRRCARPGNWRLP